MTTQERIEEIAKEAQKAGKTWGSHVHRDTGIITVYNPERVSSPNGEPIPSFYIAKYHKGKLVSETFI